MSEKVRITADGAREIPAEQLIPALRREMEKLRHWNERVAVCADHVNEIIDQPCLVCRCDAQHAEVASLKAERARIVIALDESVKLQSHQARMLNTYDGGARMAFDDGADWIARLEVCGRFAKLAAEKEQQNG